MRIYWAPVIFLLLQVNTLSASEFLYYPDASYDSTVPSLKQVVGFDFGQRITTPAQIERYLLALEKASPLVKVVSYAESWEGRKLYCVVISSRENMAKLERIQQGIQRLAAAEPGAKGLIRQLPSIAWLAYGVHGNEISSPDAALLTAYHLIASRDDALVDSILQNTITILDPMQNPDGRNRFVSYFNQTLGRWPDQDSAAAEHNEVWPSGRSNHYLFDMNRDWFAMTQPETRGRIKAYLEWYPQVFADLHEMGGDSSYYFAPPADPLNPLFTPPQINWLQEFGRNNARWFDRFRFDYFTREVFDSFYPGYGEGWPMFQGTVGMTYEQASVRGLVLKRSDETVIHYRDSVRHHFIASLSTLETAAKNRQQLLEYFYEYRISAAKAPREGEPKEFILPLGADANRTVKLVNLLLDQGIDVKKSRESFRSEKVRDYSPAEPSSREFPAGTFIVPVAQPSGRLAQALLQRDTPMDQKFIAEQKRRREKNLRDQIYDVTAWSLPLIYGVPCYVTDQNSKVAADRVDSHIDVQGRVEGTESRLAYLIPWGTQSGARMLSSLFRRNIRVHSSDRPFSINGTPFPAGSLIVKTKDNPEDLYRQLSELAAQTGTTVYSTDTSWVDSGVNFGSNQVHFLKKPRIAMVYGLPTSPPSTGSTRFVLEQQYEYPVTLINGLQLSRADLNRYNVIIMPSTYRSLGGYSRLLGETGVNKIKQWVRSGGTLVTFAEATRWLTEEKVALLSTVVEKKQGSKDTGDSGKKPDNSPADEQPGYTPGALLRVTVDNEHWLGFGYGQEATVLVDSRRIFTPLKKDQGTNVVLYKAKDDLVASGFTWEDAREQLAHKAFLMYQAAGSGHVVAFAEEPNFRAFMDGLNILFLNAVLLGPGH